MRPLARSLISIVAVLLLCGSSIAASAAPADDAFRQLTQKFIEDDLRTYPEMATEEGDHRYDSRLTDHRRARRSKAASVRRRNGSMISRRSRPDHLVAANEADREWLIAQLDGRLLDASRFALRALAGRRTCRSARSIRSSSATSPRSTVRMNSATARETAALHNLAVARVNLKPARTAKVTVDIVLLQMPAMIGFLQKDLPEAFASVLAGPAKTAFLKANAKLAASMQDYAKWLKNDFRPHATGNYAIGAEAYKRMLADQEMVDIPLADLETVGEDELIRLQADFQKTAHRIDPNHSPAEVAATLNREHPTAEQLIPTVTAGLAELREYVVAHHLATIPSEVPPLVRETPPAMRATTFASMDTPGPFEKSTEAYFYVTLPDPSWPESRREQLLEFFSAPLISDTSVHEVYPGHYVQFLNNRLNPDKVRAIYASGANAEGWALYCEQMMLDEGLHNGDPKYRLAQLQMALMRACRYLVGIKMHTQGDDRRAGRSVLPDQRVPDAAQCGGRSISRHRGPGLSALSAREADDPQVARGRPQEAGRAVRSWQVPRRVSARGRAPDSPDSPRHARHRRPLTLTQREGADALKFDTHYLSRWLCPWACPRPAHANLPLLPVSRCSEF